MRASAVADAEAGVVLSADDLVADPELPVAEGRRFASEPPASVHERVRGLVELADVVAAVGEHHVVGSVALGCLPPVGEQPLLRRGRVVVDCEPAALGGVGEVGLGVAAAQPGERFAFERVALATVLRRARSFRVVRRARGRGRRRRRRVAGRGRRRGAPSPPPARRGGGAVRARASRPCRPRRPRARSRVGAPARTRRAAARCRVRLGMPVAAWSSSAARPLGAAPSTTTLLSR